MTSNLQKKVFGGFFPLIPFLLGRGQPTNGLSHQTNIFYTVAVSCLFLGENILSRWASSPISQGWGDVPRIEMGGV